jgi:hypothetical protein
MLPLLSDVPGDDMCGVSVNQVVPANERWYPLLLQAVARIPDVKVGDSVWRHCDMIHGVDPVSDQTGLSKVMYIPDAPWCPRNETYAASVREAFRAGSSLGDFPTEHDERTACTRLACRSTSYRLRRPWRLRCSLLCFLLGCSRWPPRPLCSPTDRWVSLPSR